MSLVFNDTSTLKGLVQIYEKEIGANQGDVSGNTAKLKAFMADCNLALDDFIAQAIKSSGKWQFDDSNQTDYSVIYTNLVSGQQDYSFTTDETGNLILDIYKVMVLPSATATTYGDVYPVDTQTDEDIGGLASESGSVGTPTRYDKTANGIFLDPIPNYNATKGLKVYINREGSYFAYTDTTKKPGVPGLFHKYLALKPAMDYARRNNLANVNRIELEVAKYEAESGPVSIKEYFSRRSRDERPRLTIKMESNK
jgi:hypothetical protein